MFRCQNNNIYNKTRFFPFKNYFFDNFKEFFIYYRKKTEKICLIENFIKHPVKYDQYF